MIRAQGRASVRTTLALVSVAVTSMVAIAFLIPLAVIVRDVARDRAFTSAELAGAAIEPVLSITTDRTALERAIASTQAGAAGNLAIYLTGAPSGAGGTLAGGTLAGGTLVGGPQRASDADVRMATVAARSFIAPVPGGYAVLQPVALGGGKLAVTEVYVPAADVSHGVTASWAVMTGVALALIAVSVIVADRLATRVTRPVRELAAATASLGDGDLSARSTARGPAELAAAGNAFNVMADRLSSLITAERVMSADLPHRLRTPLTALRMNAAGLGPGRAAEDTRIAIDRLEQQVDLIIRAARRPEPDEPSNCDAAKVLVDRFGFWSALAEDQGRPCYLTGADQPVPVPVPRSDLVAAADAMIGNIFKHTAEGTEFAVTLHDGQGIVLILFADAGPGIADPDAALRRGSSGAGSTGLGLDIARRVAESTGGGLKIDTSALGGAQVQMRLRTGSPPGERRIRRRRLSAPEPRLKHPFTPPARADAVVSVTRDSHRFPEGQRLRPADVQQHRLDAGPVHERTRCLLRHGPDTCGGGGTESLRLLTYRHLRDVGSSRENREITVSKFMVLYRAQTSSREQMANATPEQREAGTEAWRAWAAKVGYAISDLGAPLAHTTHVGPGAASSDGVRGYSIIEAGSAEEVETILDGHPHLAMPGASIEVLELIPIEDM